MTDLIFLGIGAIRPTIPGDHTAMLIQHGPANILLDAGPAIMAQLYRVGVDMADISHVYLSHQHGDHMLGSPLLLFHHRRRVILGAPAVLDAWQAMVELVYPGYLDVLADEVQVHPLPVMKPHMWPDLPGVSAQIALVYHANLPAYALRLDFAPQAAPDPQPGFSLCYSGDTAPTACVEQLAAGVDLLIHEATFLASNREDDGGVHSSAYEAARVAQKAGVKALALVHRLAGSEEDWYQEAVQAFTGPILVPQAGDRLSLPKDLGSTPELI